MDSGKAPRVLPAVPGTDPALAQLEACIRGARGRISPLYAVLLRSPVLAGAWEQFFTVIRGRTSVPARLRELVILRIAVLNGARYEFDAHVPHALRAGLTHEALEDVRNENPGAFGTLERLVLRYTDLMTREIEVPQPLFDELEKAFDAAALVELTATIAAYNMVSRFLVALRIH